LQGEQLRQERQGLVAAAFNAWLTLGAQVEKPPKWSTYLKNLGLSDEPKLSKKDIKREADHAMANAQRIVERARKNGSR